MFCLYPFYRSDIFFSLWHRFLRSVNLGADLNRLQAALAVAGNQRTDFLMLGINADPEAAATVGQLMKRKAATFRTILDVEMRIYIHQYDQHAKWVRTFGGIGEGLGQLSTPHGLWLDDRPGREPAIVVADRANARLQYFTLDGEHLGFVNDLLFPANIDTQGEVMLVPDLHARVSLYDIRNAPMIHLGDDPAWRAEVLANNFQMRSEPHLWQPGHFIHPHDACFDHDGNIFVVEWVDAGRVTFLKKVG